MATSYVIAMSGASDATTEQYFSSDRSTACRTLASSAPSPRTATSDAVHVAAASSSSSTGDVAAAESPSTRIGGRPAPLPSNCSSRSHRIVTSAAFAISVAPARGEADVQPVPAHPVHAVILEQPVERGPVPQLESEDGVEPEAGALWVGAAAVTPRQADAEPEVRGRHLLVAGEAPQRLETADVGVRTIEEAEFRRRTQAQATRKQIAEVERRSHHELAGSSEVDAAAYAESEQPDARTAVPAVFRRLELLRRRCVRGKH